MAKYAGMIVSLEAFTMDTGDTETCWDGYYSVGRYLYIRYRMGLYVRDPF